VEERRGLEAVACVEWLVASEEVFGKATPLRRGRGWWRVSEAATVPQRTQPAGDWF
jgi:hypothetical protein